jgi:splicing factor 3B subunit 3
VYHLRISFLSGRIQEQGKTLELMHKTQLDGIPGALVGFKGRLLAGVGPVLRLLDLGKKKLLRKCEYRQLPHHVVTLQTMGSRIFVGDVQVRGRRGESCDRGSKLHERKCRV